MLVFVMVFVSRFARCCVTNDVAGYRRILRKLDWLVNLVVMSVFILSELGLNYIHIYIYNYIYIYIYSCSQLSSGHRKRGRPRLQFKDTIKRNLKLRDIKIDSWTSLSQQRDKWRATVK